MILVCDQMILKENDARTKRNGSCPTEWKGQKP